MNIIKVKDYETLSQVASQMIIDLIKSKPTATLGLATGGSPVGLYQALIKRYQAGEVSFKDVKTFNLDEYCHLNRNHPESYYSFMHRQLFDHIDILEENTHLPNAQVADLTQACNAYNQLLAQSTIDLQLLGIGGNGHIGFNEPNTPFDSVTQIIELTEKTRQDNQRFFQSLDEVPRFAITMGIKNIMDAKSILLIASGKAKAEAIRRLIDGQVHISFPASILNQHPDVTVIVDEEAASLLCT